MFDKNRIIEKMNRDHFAIDVVGIEIVDVSEGWSRVRLVVGERHLNGVGITQGGVLFTLADYAFAIATNTVEGQVAVGIECNMSYMSPSKVGAELICEARETSRTRSLAAVEATITDSSNGKTLARFYGRAFVKELKEG
jgi:acyl-CoA thioesterase